MTTSFTKIKQASNLQSETDQIPALIEALKRVRDNSIRDRSNTGIDRPASILQSETETDQIPASNLQSETEADQIPASIT